MVAAITDAGAEAWVHSCAPQTPWSLVAGTGVTGLSADLDMLGPADLDTFAEALEAGRTIALGVVPSTDPAAAPSDARLTERSSAGSTCSASTRRPAGEQLVVTPTCGLAGATPGVGRAGRYACRRRSRATSDQSNAVTATRAVRGGRSASRADIRPRCR